MGETGRPDNVSEEDGQEEVRGRTWMQCVAGFGSCSRSRMYSRRSPQMRIFGLSLTAKLPVAPPFHDTRGRLAMVDVQLAISRQRQQVDI